MSYTPNPDANRHVQPQVQPMMRPTGPANAWAYYPSAQQQQAANYAAMRQYHPHQLGQPRPPEASVPEEPAPPADNRIAKKPPASSKGLFLKDLKEIMFGLGDEAPAPDTVALMEDILVEYLHELVTTAGQGAGKTIQADDLRRALQGPGDERKLARLEELILLQVEIKKARAINGLEAGGRNLAD